MRHEEPDCRGAVLIITIYFIGLLLSIAFGAWAYFRETEIEPPVVTHIMDEGLAKAIMIFELTGRDFPPDVARHAVISFSGTSVAVDTESLNIWLGRNWKEKIK